MLISLRLLQMLMQIESKGVLHVGAHRGQEALLYEKLGFQRNSPTIWVEAEEGHCQFLTTNLNQEHNNVLCAVVSNKDGEEVNFHCATNDQASSMLPLKNVSIYYPEITVARTSKRITQRLDSILSPNSEFYRLRVFYAFGFVNKCFF